MPRRYFVQISDDKITGLTDIDAVAVPDDHTAVLETVIRAADPPGGRWPHSGRRKVGRHDLHSACGRRRSGRV